MTRDEIFAVVNTANDQRQAIAVGFTLGYIQARSVEPTMELFTRVSASAPELATADGREALTKVIDEWVSETSTLQRIQHRR